MKRAIDEARQILASAKRIVSFSGAGLSAESGVPTFRESSNAGTGLWSKYDPMALASPAGFARDPNLVVEWYSWRRRLIAEAEPNAAHLALAKRDDITHVTQNVDDLLHRAGAGNIIQLHGAINRDRCHHHCGFEQAIHLADPPPLRRCSCGAYVRPGVVWFGEPLPVDAWTAAERACTQCDAMLVIGTSAVVYPAAGLRRLARSHGARIIVVNVSPNEASSEACVEVIGPAATVVPDVVA